MKGYGDKGGKRKTGTDKNPGARKPSKGSTKKPKGKPNGG